MEHDPSGNSLETVLVKAAAGPMRINKRDYDSNPDAWELVDDGTPSDALQADDNSELTDAERARAAALGVLIGGNWKPSTARRKIAEAEVGANGGRRDYTVVERNGRHYVVDKVTGADTLELNGYASAVEAWTAATTDAA